MCMYENYSCCQTPNCGCNNVAGYGCHSNHSAIYVVIVLFVLCAFAKRSCIVG